MNLSKPEILERLRIWLLAWDAYDLDGVMSLLHDGVVFENWTGAPVVGKRALRLSWALWFRHHGNFKFLPEDIFVDEAEQKVLFRWQLDWPAPPPSAAGQREVRRGVDVLEFVDGKIKNKYSYIKTRESPSR